VRRTFIIILILLLNCSLLRPEENSFVERQKLFTRELYIKGRYFDYIAEVERLKLFDSNETLDYCIYSAYYHGGQYNTIVNNYRYYSENEKMKLPASLLVARAYMELGQYSMSYKALQNFPYEDLNNENQLSLFTGRIESLIHNDDMESVKQEISAADPFLRYDKNFILMRNELLAAENIRFLSPPGAAAMSALIPGAGQVYSGYIYEGILSFISVASSMAGGIYLKKTGEKNSSYTLFFFSGLFYTGNIYGAYNASLKANDMALQSWRSSISAGMEPFNPDKYCKME